MRSPDASMRNLFQQRVRLLCFLDLVFLEVVFSGVVFLDPGTSRRFDTHRRRFVIRSAVFRLRFHFAAVATTRLFTQARSLFAIKLMLVFGYDLHSNALLSWFVYLRGFSKANTALAVGRTNATSSYACYPTYSKTTNILRLLEIGVVACPAPYMVATPCLLSFLFG